jgi:hypothetical protein
VLAKIAERDNPQVVAFRPAHFETAVKQKRRQINDVIKTMTGVLDTLQDAE